MNPCDALRPGFRLRHLERGCGWIEPNYLDAACRETAGKRSCSTADVKHRTRAKLIDHRLVSIQVRAIVIKRVIDSSKSWILKKLISHLDAPNAGLFSGRQLIRMRVCWPGAARRYSA